VIGPVLVVADNPAIARLARGWQQRFATAGRLHRVRLVGVGGELEVAAVVDEAHRLAAVEVLAAGGEQARAVAADAAGRLGLPLLQEEADDHDAE